MTQAGTTTRAVPGDRPPSRPRRAFTLLELVLAILLIALFATVTAPRLIGTQSRRADLEADAVRSLLSITAHRAATTTEPLALVYDEASSTLWVEVRRLLASANSRDAELAWRKDQLIAPVTLSLTELRDAATDVQALGKRSWRIALTVTEPRPSIRLTLAGRAGSGIAADRIWTVELPAESPAAILSQSGAAAHPASRPGAIDLDAAGRGQQPW